MAMAGASLAVLNCWLVELCRRKRGAAVPGMRSLFGVRMTAAGSASGWVCAHACRS